jgi:hypothetical protein
MEQLNLAIEHVINGVTLQAAYLNRLLPFFVHHAGAFAQHFCGANTSATRAQNICFKDHARRAAEVTGVYLLNEGRHVNMRWTGVDAGRIKTI